MSETRIETMYTDDSILIDYDGDGEIRIRIGEPDSTGSRYVILNREQALQTASNLMSKVFEKTIREGMND